MGDMVEVHSLSDLLGRSTEPEWGLARRVYAAALDVDPGEVDDTDGGYGDVAHLLAEDNWELCEALARALRLPDDAEWWQIMQRIDEWRSALGIQEGDTA